MPERTSTHNNIDPSWFPQTPEIRYNKGLVVWEFWKTFSTLKSETICTYISKKKDIKEEINNPLTLKVIKFNLFSFLEVKNWEIAKSKDNQSDKYPKVGAIN